jgi:hypothetical protein
MITAQHLARISKRLIERAGKGRVTTCSLKEHAPTIARQIMMDADSPLLELWGTSRNFDENARDTIVHRKTLTAINHLAGMPQKGDVHHAGLLHTYGYLFSLLKTPYGYKRDRWLRPTIENGLRIPAHTVRAEPREGTLLQNLTYFLGRIIFRDSPRELQTLAISDLPVAAGLVQYDYHRLNVDRISERVTLPGDNCTSRRVTLLTDLVRFIPRRKSQKTVRSLLIYAAYDAAQGGTKLLTCFTVTSKVSAMLCDSTSLGRNKPIRLRYNGVIDGFPHDVVLGTRRLVTEQHL